MSIVETNSKGTRITRGMQGLAGAAVVSAAVFASAPKAAHATYNWTTTGDVSYFQSEFWVNGTFTGTLPDQSTTVIPGMAHTGNQSIGIETLNTSFPASGLIFDPGAASVSDGSGGDSGGIGNSSYFALTGTNVNGGTFSLFNGSNANLVGPNATTFEKLTIKSGTILANVWSIGRNGPAWVQVNGGEMISNGKVQLAPNFDGSTIEYHGGTILAKNQIQAGGSGGQSTNPTKANFQVWNDGPTGAFEVSNGFLLANGSANSGVTTVVEFHYGVDAINGRTRPVQSIGTNANMKVANSNVDTGNSVATSRSEVNLILNAAPTQIGTITTGTSDVFQIPQNLGLFHENTITGFSSFPKNFYATDGSTLYTQGATVSATFGGFTYQWTISYSGLITFTNSAASAYDTTGIAAGGANDVVLVGIGSDAPVPEPTSVALLGGVGSLILARRRQRKA